MAFIRISASAERSQGLEALVVSLGSAKIQMAAAQGLNEHVRLQERQVIRVLSAQTSIPGGHVQAVTRTRLAGAGGGDAAIIVEDAPIPAGKMTSISWSRGAAGARIGDWGGKMLRRSFTIRRYGGAVFIRKPGAKKYPIVRAWGPVLPNEMLRKDQPNIKQMQRLRDRDLEKRVLDHISRALA